MTATEFYHYGMPKRSGRYPYGSGERPFQSSGGKVGFFQKRKIQKQEKDKLEKARAAARREKEVERLLANKEKVIREGSASELMKYKGLLSNNELRKATDRLQLENTLKSYAEKETTSNIDKMDRLMNNVQKGTKWIGIGTDAYNAIASIYNATDAGKKDPLTYVQKSTQNQEKEKKKK